MQSDGGLRVCFSTDVIADFQGLLGSSARETLRRSVFRKNGAEPPSNRLARPGSKSRNLQAADVALKDWLRVGKGVASCVAHGAVVP